MLVSARLKVNPTLHCSAFAPRHHLYWARWPKFFYREVASVLVTRLPFVHMPRTWPSPMSWAADPRVVAAGRAGAWDRVTDVVMVIPEDRGFQMRILSASALAAAQPVAVVCFGCR